MRKSFLIKNILKKTGLSIAALVIVLGILSLPTKSPDRPITWGVTFSDKFAKLFDVPWKESYIALLDDLGARNLRLAAYWDESEATPGEYIFDDLDWMLGEATRRDAKVILAIGRKEPRWPECHVPTWALAKAKEAQNEKLLTFIRVTIDRYENHPAIAAWQIENEPFLGFGECPPIDADFLDSEIREAELRTTHPIIVTDSGEIGRWYSAAKRGDVFGTTMYRQIQKDGLGIFTYPIPPAFFRVKERLVRLLLWNFKKEFLVIELQGEPWMKKQLYETDPDVQRDLLSPEKLDEYMRYAVRAGFDTYYLWGTEWWYWLKVKHNDPRYWEYIKNMIQSGTGPR